MDSLIGILLHISLEILDPKARKVFLANKDHKVKPDYKEMLVLKGNLESKDQTELTAQKVLKDHKVNPDQPEQMENSDLLLS